MTPLSYRTIAKALFFMVIGVVAAVLVVNTLRVPVGGKTTDYVLMFQDAEGLNEGNPVKMSGVRVGRVSSVELVPQSDGSSLARVEVEVKAANPFPEHVAATVRYGDMLGARYIDVEDSGAAGVRRDGDTVPVAATAGPVNLSALMNGFEPLFSSLEPDQVNELAQGFVDTFSGRTKSVHLLLEQIASMGSNLSANRTVFARLVTNLNVLMETADQRSGQLTELFDGLGDLTSAIVGDDGQFTKLLDSGDKAVGALASMMTSAGDDFKKSLDGLHSVTDAWIPNTAKFNTFLDRFPVMADKINHAGRYGGFMMLYMCNFTLKAFDVEANIFGPTHSPVCR